MPKLTYITENIVGTFWDDWSESDFAQCATEEIAFLLIGGLKVIKVGLGDLKPAATPCCSGVGEQT